MTKINIKDSGFDPYGEWICNGTVNGIEFYSCVSDNHVVWIPVKMPKNDVSKADAQAIEKAVLEEYKRKTK